MKEQFGNNNLCPGCGRHCPPNDLHCPRGEAILSGELNPRQHGKSRRQRLDIKDETVALLMRCGHTLHHGLAERAANEDILSFLSAEEKSELTSLLQKCIDAWENR